VPKDDARKWGPHKSRSGKESKESALKEQNEKGKADLQRDATQKERRKIEMGAGKYLGDLRRCGGEG